jgi:predicted aminopeptidase
MLAILQYTAARLALVLAALAGLAVAAGLSGCADAAYYLQSAQGHMGMMRAAKPVEQWLADDQNAAALKARLALAQRIRRFAVTDLALPDNASYTRYADLHRRAVVWNVVAAPEFSLTLKTWCFPVAGCVGYRGYFDEADARALAGELKAQGMEASVYGVPAYSTLGWMNWAGGDPLLNTFINYPEGELARLIFHELAHQVAYAKDDTPFNESFATAVERLGGARWLARQGSPTARAEYTEYNRRRTEFRNLSLATRSVLAGIYQEKEAVDHDRQAQTAMKKEALKDFREHYAALKSGWVAASGLSPEVAARQFSGYDLWVANANNAAFGAQAAYDELVPDFEALFERMDPAPGKQWQAFYDEVKRLADLPKPERKQALTGKVKTKPHNQSEKNSG